MATLKGLWVWNTSVNFTNSYSYLGLSYTSNNTAFNTISIEASSGGTIIKYNSNTGGTTVAYDGEKWVLDAYRTIDFGTTEQECPDEFYTEFTANAKSESSGGDTPTTPEPDEPDNPDTPETTPTEDSVKAKIQSLITKANSTTGKGDSNLTKAVLSLVAGYGQGGGSCNLNHIIEVEELPTEGIVQTNLYKMGGTYYQYKNNGCTDLIVVDGGAESFVELAAAQGITIQFFTVDNYENVVNPNPIVDNSTGSVIMSMYYDASRDDMFIYSEGTWLSFSEDLDGISNGGAITDANQATEEGHYYALVELGWKPLGAAEYTGEVVIE